MAHPLEHSHPWADAYPAFYTALENHLRTRLADITLPLERVHTCKSEEELADCVAKETDALLLPTLLHGGENPQNLLLCAGEKLKGDGVLLACVFGGKTGEPFPQETRNALPEVQDVGDLLTRLQFALPVVDAEMLTLTFSSLEKLNAFGGVLGFFQRPLEEHEATPREDGMYVLEVELLTLTAWKPHKSQPKPLARGAYKVSFEEVL